jgi:SOS-response transcriptional repressor LexA
MSQARPTKKQQQLLRFIDGFIKGNGYGPSYREIMRGLGYKSVSTVALHIDNLVQKGLLQKTGEYNARSVEIVTHEAPTHELASLTWLRRREKTFRSNGDVASADVVAAAIKLLDQTDE